MRTGTCLPRPCFSAKAISCFYMKYLLIAVCYAMIKDSGIKMQRENAGSLYVFFCATVRRKRC